MIVWGGPDSPENNRIMADWCAQRIWGDERRFGSCTTMGVILKGKPAAVMVFHNWSPQAGVIEMSGASTTKRWLSRPTLLAMYGYVFDTCGCQMLVQRNSEKTEQLNVMLRRFGYDEIRLPRMRGRNEDEILFMYPVEAWRIKEKELKREQT